MQIERVYSRIRAEERSALEQRTREAQERCPGLAALAEERRTLLSALAGRSLSPAEASARLSALAAEEQALLSGAGFPEDQLSLRFRCPQCQDTGWLGATQRRPCQCRLKLSALLDPAIGVNERETFEAFREDVYQNETQKKQMLNAKKWCEAYADALPKLEKPNVLLMGVAGLGKSYLGNAIAYRALCRGIAARRVTAFAFTQAVLGSLRSAQSPLPALLSVPLLVLDDLGTEPIIPNVSEEAIFSLLNERINARRATVVATNLSFTVLQERYGERVLSRLTDRGVCQTIQLTGENLRWSKSLC